MYKVRSIAKRKGRFEERIEELNRAHEQEGVTVATANAARFEKRNLHRR